MCEVTRERHTHTHIDAQENTHTASLGYQSHICGLFGCPLGRTRFFKGGIVRHHVRHQRAHVPRYHVLTGKYYPIVQNYFIYISFLKSLWASRFRLWDLAAASYLLKIILVKLLTCICSYKLIQINVIIHDMILKFLCFNGFKFTHIHKSYFIFQYRFSNMVTNIKIANLQFKA